MLLLLSLLSLSLFVVTLAVRNFRYLSAARKWVPEGIDAWSSYLHLVAWALPAILTIAVLTTHKVVLHIHRFNCKLTLSQIHVSLIR